MEKPYRSQQKFRGGYRYWLYLMFFVLDLFIACSISKGEAHRDKVNSKSKNAERNMTICEMNIVNAGLPYRTDVLLARERNGFLAMKALLLTPGLESAEAEPLTDVALIKGLASGEAGRPYIAAFLIGRCIARDTVINMALTQSLKTSMSTNIEADVSIEIAMSLVLRGEIELGREKLLALKQSSHPLSDQYKAAFYLAQIGDPSGYGVLVDALNNEIPHYRLMALRHAIAFEPYTGQIVDGQQIDVRQLLVEKLKDPDEILRSEVPFYLEELKIPDLSDILQFVVEHDSSLTVRTAARIVLERKGH